MKKIVAFLCLLHFSYVAFSQMTLQMTGEINHICNGTGCNYEGPSILINEVMLSPVIGDGSIYDLESSYRSGEWIELYNPDKCNPVDISCYFLGNNTPEMGHDPGGFSIPPGTVVPPQGFVVIRGVNATPVPSHLLIANGGNTIEIIVDSRVCIGGVRLWFPNAGGWFAFYDQNGIPQDAISWANPNNSCMSCNPCNPTEGDCSYTGVLPSYDDIPAGKKARISQYEPTMGYSFRRIPDGGPWAISQPASPTIGTCNTICNGEPVITCDGTATAVVSGGTPPYSYIWSDGQHQTTATAVGLCAGNYCVTVTDANNSTETSCYTVENYVPPVSHEDLYACKNETAITLTGGNPSGGSYSGMGVTGNIFTIYDDSDLYTLTYTYADTNGCANSANFALHINPAPEINLDFPDTVCQGDNVALSVYGSQEDVDLVLYEDGRMIYEDQIAANVIRMYGLQSEQTQSYSLFVTNALNCVSRYDFQIVVMPKPIADFIANPEVALFPEYEKTLFQNTTTRAGTGNVTWNWDFGDGVGSSTLRDPVYVYQDFGEFDVTLSVLSANGCFDEVTHKVILEGALEFPNVMTLNGDGINDVFAIRNLNINRENHLFIYDRWGKKVYDARNYKTYIRNEILYNSDAGFKAEGLSPGTYYFVFNYEGIMGKSSYHGSLTLLR